ncbi:MAG: CsgG/HfaB family protein [Chitinispirillia bacterium]|nr:CsgG/HfaB family protein [Chitinispirillia bacterium]MCL2242142.1 CsgG/HfaB family protein [Chitinispirillia bacterium]
MIKKLTRFLIVLTFIAAPVLAQDQPRIAVYVTGNIGDDEKSALGTVMLSSLVNSGRYRGIERSGAFLAEIEREQTIQRSGAIDDSQISELGRQFGVKFVCIAAITPAFGSYQISARVVDVETAEVVFIGQAFSPLQSAQDLTQASEEVVSIMFRGQTAAETRSAAHTAENVTNDGRTRTAPAPIAAPSAKSASKSTYWAVGFDVLGAGLITYGIIQNGDVGRDYNGKADYDKVKKSEKNRNIAYAAGAAVLLGGVTIHIFF